MGKDGNELSYDIFEWFPILYCQNVFTFLEGKDIIQASAVNKEWNKLATENKQTRKLKLLIDHHPRGILPILENTKRKYENVEFHRVVLKNTGVFKALGNHNNLKFLRIDRVSVAAAAFGSVFEFVKANAQTLETLELGVNINQECFEIILNMPRLSSLKAGFARLDWNKELIVNTTVKHIQCDGQSIKGDQWIDDDNFKALVRGFPGLESLKSAWFLVTHFPEDNIFPKIKEFEANYFGPTFHEPIGDNNFAQLVRNAMRSLQNDTE